MVRKLDLTMAISKAEPHPSPNAYLEQYTIPADTAAEILYMAAYTYGDILSKTVIDLGCGTGRLAIGAAWLGAREVIGVDIDKVAIAYAVKNAEKLGVQKKISWVIADISAIRGKFDTVIENPPFGVQKKRADRAFVEKALQIGKRVYSLHKAEKQVEKWRGHSLHSSFLKGFIEENGGEIKAVYTLPMSIPRMFTFHQKRKHQFNVDLYVMEAKEQKVY